MLSTSLPSNLARSSLEVMLESIRRRDEQPKDLPPALPVRPTSKARLPSARRSLPLDFKIGERAPDYLPNGRREEEKTRDDKDSVYRGGSHGWKEMMTEPPCPCKSDKENYERDGTDFAYASLELSTSTEESDVLKRSPHCWCWFWNGQWELGKIQSRKGDNAAVLLSDGRVLTVPTGNLLPANPGILEGVDDLMRLSYLNEPSILHNLQYRFSHDMIYSNAGPVLVAINPFKDFKLYGDEFVTAYRQKMTDSPHVYSIADAAYKEMMKDELNQSIIISGKSGAGKTETAKFAMQYLAAISGGCGIEYKVLQTSCILEAFGNAKTPGNNNSSRFGKLIEIHFSSAGKMCSAMIQTFLLEKSRVVQLAQGERSYHIFYQLCAGAPPSIREKLNLKTAREYDYLKQSNCFTIEEVDDAHRFHMLMEALDIVQLCKQDQENMFTMLSAVLWLGNISFQVTDNENHVKVVADEAVANSAKLLGCKVEDLMLALSSNKIQACSDNIPKRLTLSQAIKKRDALAQSIYENLFDWIVQHINKSLEVGKQHAWRFINILDMYGFESYQKNRFEQFCINYANERLQQHFNRHLFKFKQEEYIKDGIDWTKVDFEDNQECLNLFEKLPLGLLSLLDEESTCPSATDLTFVNKLKQHLNVNPCFKGGKGGAFSVCHCAGEVLYDTNGFLEKNRDLLHFDFIQLLTSCGGQMRQLFSTTILHQSLNQGSPLGWLHASDSQKQSVGMKFKGQLFKLMQQLENTTPHFICCIKPNSNQLPGMYENNLVLQQLRCCGIKEVVRISRSGYPTQMTHQQFASRYGFLLLGDLNLGNIRSRDPLSISVAVLQQFKVLPDTYQVGFTKLFFRKGQIDVLEDIRKRTMQGIPRVQKCYRGYQVRRHFHEIKRGINALQSFVRGELARKEYQSLAKRQGAILLIQRQIKCKFAWKTVNNQQKAVIDLQSAIRGWLARKHFRDMQKLEKSDLENAITNRKPSQMIRETKDMLEHVPNPPSLVGSQRRFPKAESTPEKKDKENVALWQQIQQLEMRCSEYEAQMKSMEDMWQKQVASLQMSLAAARRGLASDGTAGQPGVLDSSLVSHYYDSEGIMSLGIRTPDGSTPIKFSSLTPDARPGRVSDGGLNSVSHLMKEFEQQKQVFDDDAMFLVEVKSGKSTPIMNPDEELKNLRHRFEAWKKAYKVRLWETKAKLQKRGHTEGERSRKRWWRRRSSKVP